MKRFAAWTVIALGVMFVLHAAVLAAGGPSLLGWRPPALLPSVIVIHGESPILGRISGVVVPLCVGALAVAIGRRMLRIENEGSRKHGKQEKA